jgi:chromosome segregation ATPase
MLFKWSLFGLAAASLYSNAASLDSDMSKSGAIKKVVSLLKEMKAQNEKEGKEDQEIFDKLACWCHTNREEKTAAVAAAEQKIADLEASIKEYTAKYAMLGQEIANLKKDIAENMASLEAATAQREKEAAEFHKGETDSIQALGQLKGAVTILSRHNADLSTEADTTGIVTKDSTLTAASAGGAFLQGAEKDEVISIVKAISRQFPSVVNSDDLSLVQAPAYSNQSSEIFGILRSMQETMTKDLSDAQAAEAKSAADFQAMRDAKREEIAAARTQLENKEAEYADTGLKNAESKEDLADTTAQLEADNAFLIDLEKRCADNEAEMAARTKTRQAEIVAINETITILTNDEARDTANVTNFGTSFLQTRIAATKEKMFRDRAAKALKSAALKTGSPELAMLASSVQLDAFTKVKKAIDDMIAQLKIDMKDEVKHKDFCNTEFHSNESQTTEANRKLDGLKATQDDLESSIANFETELKTLSAEIQEMRVELQSATNDRKAESHAFQVAVQDQKEMQQILKKAVKRMDMFYNSKEGEAFVQAAAKDAQAPPPSLTKDGYQKNQGAGGVIGMLQEIISDSQEAEMEFIKSEQAATAAYEEFVGNSNSGIEMRQRATITATDNKAAADKELVQTKEDISATLTELEKLAEYNAQLHKSCDFVVKNFEVRQTARSQEIEALQQAKQILSGAQ